MAERIETAAVLGAGVMGTGIAAHLAGAGIRTHLLDIAPDGAKDKSQLAKAALNKALEAKPAAFFDPDAARLIDPGNFDEHLDRLAGCDLIIEAVVENLDIKRKLFAKIAPHIGGHALLASNTSGLSIAAMSQSLPPELQSRFCVMHFFNPVRYMHLLEIVAGPKTDAAQIDRAARLGAHLGKGVVHAKDTPNFVANRIGVYGLMRAIKTMMDDGFSIEEVDKIVGTPMGRPKTAAFKTADLVGIDTFVHVARNCYDNLTEDEERGIFQMPDWIEKLVEQGRLGRKSGSGFYKKAGSDVLVLDVESGDYRAQNKVRYDSLGAARNVEDAGERLKGVVNAADRAGQFAWKMLSHSLCYTARRLGEIADDVVQIDRAMRWGFNWDLGPFEAWDAIGVADSVARMQKDGLDVPANVIEMLDGGRDSFYQGPLSKKTYFDVGTRSARDVPRDPRNLRLGIVRENKANVLKENFGASLLDIGDGVLCLEVHTKMNTLDDDVGKMILEGITEAEKDFRALVIGNEGEHFGAGANLMLIFMMAQQKQWDQIDRMVSELQQGLQRLRYAKVPVVAAPFQYTFAGCAEVAMAADACQAFAETYMGLVEVGVGLVPAGGGCLRMVERWTEDAQGIVGVDLLPFIGQASLNIATAKVATGAEEAKRLRYLRDADGITWIRDHLLYEAKQRAIGMAEAGYRPPLPRVIHAAGVDAAKTIETQVWAMVESGWASEHDALIARKVTHIVTGGNVAANTEVDEQHFLDLEREAFLSLCGEEKSQARIQSILMNNRPLRN